MDEKIKFIGAEEASKMSRVKLQTEIGKRSKYLREELGMGREEAANFIAGLLNLGVSMHERFMKKKSKNC